MSPVAPAASPVPASEVQTSIRQPPPPGPGMHTFLKRTCRFINKSSLVFAVIAHTGNAELEPRRLVHSRSYPDLPTIYVAETGTGTPTGTFPDSGDGTLAFHSADDASAGWDRNARTRGGSASGGLSAYHGE